MVGRIYYTLCSASLIAVGASGTHCICGIKKWVIENWGILLNGIPQQLPKINKLVKINWVYKIEYIVYKEKYPGIAL